MSSSRSNARNTTNTTDQRTTNTINAGIGGDIEEGAAVISGNYGDTELNHFLDQSNFEFDLEDNSDTNIDNSIDNSVTTDSGAFELVDRLGGKLIETLGESQAKTLDAANNLAARSLDGALSIKAGQTITEPANQTLREIAKAGTIIAGIAAAGFVGVKVFGSK